MLALHDLSSRPVSGMKTIVRDDSAYIPGLEAWGLAVVPGYRAFSDGTEDETWRADWFNWRDEVKVVRATIQRAMLDNPALRAAELAVCANDPAYWLAIYGTIDEPRAVDGEAYFKDFAPFAYQVKLLQWFVKTCEETVPSDGYISKARGLGATWILCAGAVWAWLFRSWRGILVSRKEDLVDKPLDLNSMFGKIDLLIEFLPRWMEPNGFDRRTDRLRMMIKNPVTKGQITGESTTGKAGRGARATYIIYDEAAFIPDFQEVFSTGAGTTNHRFAVSSESLEEGYYWWDTWHAVQKIRPDMVIELDWFHNAYFSQEWYEAERLRWEGHDLGGFAREYNRDPWEDFGQAIYPIVDSLRVSNLIYEGGYPLMVGIDPGLADDTAIVFAQWEGEGTNRSLRFLDSYERNLRPGEWYAHILTGIEPEPGDPCWGLDMNAKDREIMRFMRQVPQNMIYAACDPTGGQRDSSGKSFVERIILESLRLRTREYERVAARGELRGDGYDVPAPQAIIPMYKDLFRKFKHDDRRSSLRRILHHTCFAPTTGAERIRKCLRHYRFSEPGDKSTTQPAPIHDQYSHIATACEYLAVWLELNVLGPFSPTVNDEPSDIGYAISRAKVGLSD